MKEINFRIVHISDTHVSKFGGFMENFLDKAIKEINHLDPKPNVIVHTGDLTENGILPDYEVALEKINLFESKVVIAPGNHDERNYGQSLFKEMIGPLDYEVNVGKATLFIMNSPEPDRDAGRLGRRRQDLLERKLKALPKDHLKIVAFHHHLVPVPHAGRETNVLEDAGDVLDMILTRKVNFVLMGHRHVGRALKINNTILINAGTVSSIKTRGRLGHSYNIIDLFSDGSIKIIEKNMDENKEIEKFV
ncbi:MAG: metallophosphoesterase [Candidatus Bathyarchaeia archaeon]